MRPERSSIDEAVERLVLAYREAGLPPITAPPRRIDKVLREIAREIAPLRLPEELARFWQLVDPASLSVAPFPQPTSPDFALHCWRSHRDESPGMTPRLLFPIAYASHEFLLVELEDGRGAAGAVLQWGYGGGPFQVRFSGLSAYVDLLATMIELGELTHHSDEQHSWVEFDPEHRWHDAQAVRLAGAQPLPGLGRTRDIEEDVLRWPEHWLASNGLSPESSAPRGASTTVAELLRGAAAGRETAGTIHATVTSVAGSGLGNHVTVDDGTGVLGLWCPAAVCTFGPVLRRAFEFEVVVQPGPNAPPDTQSWHAEVQERALSGDLEGAQSAAMNLYEAAFSTPATAEARAIRPLD